MLGIRNTFALALAALRGIPQRLGASLVTLISITAVIGVLVSMLALGEGVEALAKSGARPDRAQVLASGAQSSMVSSVPRSTLPSVLDKPGIRRNAAGELLATPGFLTIFDAVTRANQRDGVGVFSVGPRWREIWPEVHLVEGRFFEPGLRELIVSERIRARFKGLDIGDQVRIQGSFWKVTGVYKTGSSFFDNGTLSDADTLLAAFPQATYTGIYLVLQSPTAFDILKKALADDPALSVALKTEIEANENTIKNIRGILDFVAYFIGGLMALGATCGALASLYAAVDARRVEIATLRAIGFGPAPVVVSVLAEGLCLALPAALLGAGIAWYLYNGQLVNGGGVNFPMQVTPQLLVISVCWAVAIALLGGSLPSIRAARLPVAAALGEV